MIINTTDGQVSFLNKEEELNVVNTIFKSFSIKRDEELTRQWLFANEDHYSDFMDMLAEIVIIHLVILQDNYEIFKKGIMENDIFINKLNATSQEIIKLVMIVMNSFKNDFNPKKHKNLDKKNIEKMYSEIISLLEKKIDYDFRFDKKIKIPFTDKK